MKRTKSVSRKTQETDIRLELCVDGKGDARIQTPVPFLDHMLTLLAKHGFFDLKVEAEGDTEVDYHHTVEDIGICLGIHGSIDACIQVCHGSLTQQDRTGSSGQHPFTVHHRLLVKTQNSLVRNRESTLLQSGNGLK
jgi:hypothetical protein